MASYGLGRPNTMGQRRGVGVTPELPTMQHFQQGVGTYPRSRLQLLQYPRSRLHTHTYTYTYTYTYTCGCTRVHMHPHHVHAITCTRHHTLMYHVPHRNTHTHSYVVAHTRPHTHMHLHQQRVGQEECGRCSGPPRPATAGDSRTAPLAARSTRLPPPCPEQRFYFIRNLGGGAAGGAWRQTRDSEAPKQFLGL